MHAADEEAVNSKLLVRRQKIHGCQSCYGEHADVTVDDNWQIADAGDQELRRLAHSSRRGTYRYDTKRYDQDTSPSHHHYLNVNKWASTPRRRNVCLRRRSAFRLAMPITFHRRPCKACDLWPVTLKTFSAMPTHMMNIYAKFHWNPSTEYRDIASRQVGINGQWTDGRTDGQPKNIMLSTYCCWRRHEKLAAGINLGLESCLGLAVV